jgi:hypothetical protein
MRLVTKMLLLPLTRKAIFSKHRSEETPMTLREFLDEAGLMPEVEGITGLMDGNRRDELLSRIPANKIETRLQGALMETLYPLAVLGAVALSFTYPSRMFLIETTMKSEIAFDLEKTWSTCLLSTERK